MFFNLEKSLQPWLRLTQEFPRTFSAYKRNSESFSIQKIKDDQAYRDENFWGDATQFFRGLGNIAKGLLHLSLSLITLVPLFFALRAVAYYLMSRLTMDEVAQGRDISFLQACKYVFKDLCFQFIKGLGLFSQGTLQIVATPLLLFRIPIRLVRAFREESKKISVSNLNPKEDSKTHNTIIPNQPVTENPSNHFSSVFSTTSSSPKLENLSPITLYEVFPNPEKPELNVKIVIWSNVKLLSKLDDENFIIPLMCIKNTINPDIILLDNLGDAKLNELDNFHMVTRDFTEKNLLIYMGSASKLLYRSAYNFKIEHKNKQGSYIIQGAYQASDTAEPLSIRFLCSEVKPSSLSVKSTEATRVELFNDLCETKPNVLWVGPQGNRPKYREGDHVIIIAPESKAIDNNQPQGVFYKSFKNSPKDMQRINGKALTVNIESQEIEEKQLPLPTYPNISMLK